MSGREFSKQLIELGMTVAAFIRISGLSAPTVYKVLNDDPSVKPATRQRAVMALHRIRAETPTHSRKVAAG